MKIRTGFVSNSSSSSFCVMGICLKDEMLSSKYFELTEYDDYGDRDCYINRELWGNNSDITLKPGFGCYPNDFILGVSVEDMRENETVIEFKKRVLNLIPEELNVNINMLKWYHDGGRDG